MLKFEDWGLIDYEQALSRQHEYVEKIAQTQSQENPKPGFLIFCSHPPVVTLGRKTQPGDVFGWTGPIKEISRGGRATYHGPSQLVIYPIVNLELAGLERKPRDIGSFLRLMENSIVDVLGKLGIEATGKTTQKKSEIEEATEETGVWVGRQKVASLGIGVKRWVTYHGAAINLDEDPQAFTGMNPCGFTRDTMVSVEKLAGKKINRLEFSEELKKTLLPAL